MSAYDPKRTFVRPKRCLRHRKDALLQFAVMHRDTETAQIKHDLEILRARYALYERTGRILKALAPVCAALLSVGAVVALIKIFERDVVFGTIFVTVVLVCVWIFWPTFSSTNPALFVGSTSHRCVQLFTATPGYMTGAPTAAIFVVTRA